MTNLETERLNFRQWREDDFKIFADYFSDEEQARYNRSDQKSENKYLKLLHRLKEKLTHPVSRSAVLFHLGDYYKSKDRLEKAQAFYREVVNLDAHSSKSLVPLSSSFTEQALDALNEIGS